MLTRHLLFAGLMTVATPVLAQQAITAVITQGNTIRTVDFKPVANPSLFATFPAVTAIRIDGVMDEAAWSNATVASNFSETFPGDQTEPPIGIEVRVTYDETHVYFGFTIEDDPNDIRASMTDRDNIWQDDYVGIVLDPYAENAWAYFIAANPFGIQGDTRIVQGGDEDIGFNIVFNSKGQITETGYTVEMAIPFRSLRFPTGDVQNWNVNFWITHPRNSRNTYSWAAKDRDDPCWLCQAGTINGIRGIKPGGKFEFLPTLVGGQSGGLAISDDPNSAFTNKSARLEPSLGIKYAFNSNSVADMALNPDFSQIESDAAQIDVNSTFALFFPERRPFFQEGSELYETPIQAVYTRSINNPSAAGKMTSRMGATNLAYLGASDADTPIILPFEEQSEFVDAGRSFSNIGRYKRTFGEGSFVGGLLTDRRYSVGGSGTSAGVDGTYRFANNYQVEGQLVASYTEEPNAPELTEDFDDIRFGRDDQYTAAFDGESYGGYAAYLSLQRDSRFWNFDLDYRATSPTFRADAGFVFRNNIQQIAVWNGFDFRPGWGFVDQITPYTRLRYDWNYAGERKEESVSIGFWGRFKAQTNAGANIQLVSNELFKGIDFRGMQQFNAWFDSKFSDPLKIGSEISIGESIARGEDVPVLGSGLDVSFWGSIKPTSRFRIEPQVNFSKLKHPDTNEYIFNGYIARGRANYQFTRRLFIRLVVQYNSFDNQIELDPLLTYSVNPYTEFHLGSTHDYRDFDETQKGFTQTQRQFFFKVRYLVRT